MQSMMVIQLTGSSELHVSTSRAHVLAPSCCHVSVRHEVSHVLASLEPCVRVLDESKVRGAALPMAQVTQFTFNLPRRVWGAARR